MDPRGAAKSREKATDCVMATITGKEAGDQSQTASAGPEFGGGPARRQPDQTQAADSMALRWRRTVKSSGTRPQLSPTFYAGAESSLTVRPPWNWQRRHDSAVCWAGLSWSLQLLSRRKSLTMRGLSAIKPAKGGYAKLSWKLKRLQTLWCDDVATSSSTRKRKEPGSIYFCADP